MNYLKYIELAAENLQFYLWLRDYTKRFNELPMNEQALSLPWKKENNEPENQARPKQLSSDTAAVFKGTDFSTGATAGVVDSEKQNPFFTPPRTPNDEIRRDAGESLDSYEGSLTFGGKKDHNDRATGAFQSAGLKWKPCELLPCLSILRD
jgi:hypothetical protein